MTSRRASGLLEPGMHGSGDCALLDGQSTLGDGLIGVAIRGAAAKSARSLRLTCLRLVV